MQTDVLTGGFTDAPVQSSHAFRAALNALSRPGQIETVEGANAPAPVSVAAATLMLVLCDAETPLHLAGQFDTPEIRQWIAFHTGAPIADPARAAFALGAWDDLMPLHRFPIGSPEYPDRSTTFLIEVDGLSPVGPRLTGPGIQHATYLSLPEIQAFQDNRALFPQGHDFFFTCAHHLAGLPRSTSVEAI